MFELIQKIDQWIDEHEEAIREALDREKWEYDQYHGSEHIVTPNYNPANCPLCCSWRHIEPPSGFNIIPSYRGRVELRINDSDVVKDESFSHSFAEEESEKDDPTVICTTSGQFTKYLSREKNITDSINYLMICAPDLVHTSPNGLIQVLRGRRNEIGERLGMWYKESVDA